MLRERVKHSRSLSAFILGLQPEMARGNAAGSRRRNWLLRDQLLRRGEREIGEQPLQPLLRLVEVVVVPEPLRPGEPPDARLPRIHLPRVKVEHDRPSLLITPSDQM